MPPLVPSHEAPGVDSGGSGGDWGGMWRHSLIGQCETHSPRGYQDGLSGNDCAPGWVSGDSCRHRKEQSPGEA